MRGIVMSGGTMPADKMMVTTLMERDLLARLDDFRYTRRFKSRAAAMKYLLDFALAYGPEPSPADHERWS